MVKDIKKIPDFPLMIRYRGPYDYDGLLKVIRAFYDKYRFNRREPKFKFKGGGSGAEVEFKFESDAKVTHYIKVHLFVTGHLWDVKHGPENNGKLEITVHGQVQFDFADKFKVKESDAHRWMKDFLDKPGSGLQFGDNKMTGEKYVERLVKNLQQEIKKHLKMECV